MNDTKERIVWTVITSVIAIMLSLLVGSIFWGNLASANEKLINHESRISVIESNIGYMIKALDRIEKKLDK